MSTGPRSSEGRSRAGGAASSQRSPAVWPALFSERSRNFFPPTHTRVSPVFSIACTAHGRRLCWWLSKLHTLMRGVWWGRPPWPAAGGPGGPHLGGHVGRWSEKSVAFYADRSCPMAFPGVLCYYLRRSIFGCVRKWFGECVNRVVGLCMLVGGRVSGIPGFEAAPVRRIFWWSFLVLLRIFRNFHRLFWNFYFYGRFIMIGWTKSNLFMIIRLFQAIFLINSYNEIGTYQEKSRTFLTNQHRNRSQ